jgi:hypothetical protein
MKLSMTVLLIPLFFLAGCTPPKTVAPLDSAVSPNAPAPQLQVSPDGHHLQTTTQEPFFWLADTAWEMLHRLDYTQTDHYLTTRRDQGFNVVQTVILAEQDGLRIPNRNGDLPLQDLDPARPNEAYFSHVDRVIKRANELGIVVALLPTWGDKFNRKWGSGPEVFDSDNARVFGKFLGKRYAKASIVWVLGGDRIPEEPEDFAIINAMAAGLQEGDGGRHLISYHPQGRQSSANFFHDASWLDFNMHQSGHGERDYANFNDTLRDANREPTKPALDAEPLYEDIPIGFKPENGWFGAFEVRRAAYWSILAGALGHTYGHHSIWQLWEPGMNGALEPRTPWQEALYYPGAYQMGYMKALFSRLPWTMLRPAQSQLTEGAQQGADAIRIATTADGNWLIAYTPFGTQFSLDLTVLPTAGYWFNPRDATQIPLSTMPRTIGTAQFDPPADTARGNDWVLVLERH